MRLLGVSCAAVIGMTTALSLVTALVRPAPPELWAYVDVLERYNLPTWFATVLLLTVATALLVAGLTYRVGGARGRWWWLGAAVGATLTSLCVGTGLHTRVDGLARQVVGANALTTDWLPAAVVIGLMIAVPFGVLAGRIPHGRWMAMATATYAVGAFGGELVSRTLGPGGRAVAVMSEGVQNAGAVGLLLVTLGAVRVVRKDDDMLVTPSTSSDAPATRAAGGPGTGDTKVPRGALWLVLIGTTLALSALSLGAILSFPTPSPKIEPWIGYVNVDAEGNLPTWWAVGLLFLAALAHLVTGLSARSRGMSGSVGWFVTSAILAGMSLDDMTSIHERVGDMVRPDDAGPAVPEGGAFSFYWVIPGAGVALLVAVAVGALALKLRGRPRWLLVGGLGVLFFFALGVEGLEGAAIAAGGGGRVATVLGYHVEELGENVGALLLIAAALAALAVRDRLGALAVRYVGAEPDDAVSSHPDPAPVNEVDPGDPTEVIPVVRAATSPFARP